MARTVKAKPIGEQIAEIEKNILSHRAAIAELSKAKKKLMREKKGEENQELAKIAIDSGLTPAQLQELIANRKKAK